MRFRHKKHVLAALIAASFAGSVTAADPQVVATLAEQARYWQGKGRGDLAAEAWQKILRVEPENVDALYALGVIEIDSGRIDGAKEFLGRLNRLHPTHPNTRRLSQAMQFHTLDKAQLERARKLAQAGKYDESVAAYRTVFGGTPPAGDFALEYYYTLAGTEKGWDEARRGLEQAARDYPDSPRHALALAQVQTYREVTRREGIRSLAALSKRPEVAAPALESWGKALTWLDARDRDRPLFREYLTSRPQDETVKQRLAEIGKTGPGQVVLTARDMRLIQGFAALNRNQLDQASSNFERILSTRPRDTDAQGGMGVVMLRQERYKEAQSLLEQAARGSSRWNTALNTATYWGLVDDANKARSANDNATAKVALVRAIGVNGYELAAPNTLGDLLVQEGDFGNGEKMYRQVLARQPDNPQALRGLFNALAGQQRGDEALALLKRIPAAEAGKLGSVGTLRATALRTQGQRALALGDFQGARLAFTDALREDPAHVWARLDLARLDLAEGRTNEAWATAEGFRAQQPPSADAKHASALLYSDLGAWHQGLAVLETVPSAERTGSMANLQRRLWMATQSEEVQRLTQAGATEQASQLAYNMNVAAGRDPELQTTAALAYAEVGDAPRALAMARQAIVQLPPTAVGPRLQYATILQRTRQEAEFVSVAQQLYAQPLTLRQRADLDNLRTGYTLRQADTLRDYGQPQRALEVLTPLASERPADPRVQMGVGRAFDSMGNREQALQHYRYVADQDPNNVEVRVAAINAAVAQRDYTTAQANVESALRLAPRDPQVLAAAGRLARAQGDYGRAAEYFKASLEAQQQSPRIGPRFNLPRTSSLDVKESGLASLDDDTVAAVSIGDAVASVGTTPTFITISFVPSPDAGKTAIAEEGPEAVAEGVAQAATPQAWPAPVIPAPVQPGVPAPQQPPQIPAQAVPIQVPIQIPMAPQTIQVPATTIPGSGAPINIYIMITPQGVQQGQPLVVPQPQYVPAPTYAVPPMAPQMAVPPATQPRVVAPRRPAPATVGPAAPAPAPRVATPVPARVAPQAAPARPAMPVTAAPAQPPIVVPPLQPTAPAAVAAPAPTTLAPIAAPPPVVVPPSPAPLTVTPAAPPPPVVAQPAVRSTISTTETESIQRELGEIEARRGSSIAAGMSFRSRSGEDGLGKMLEVEAPVEARIGVGYDKHVVLRAAGVYLDGGQLEAGNRQRIRRFGTNSLGTAAGFQNTAQSESGLGASLGYEGDWIKADIGTTPIGFRIRNTIGGLRLHGPTGANLKFLGEVGRRPVTETILSYAGTRDGRSGVEWGGVTATGGKLGLTWDDGRVGWYTLGSYHAVKGDEVVKNKRTGATAGFFVRAIDTPANRLTAGADLTFFRFEKNLRYFSLGHGGYFSPQRYMALTFPLDWTARSGRVVYQLAGSLGVQHFRENEAPVFPNNAGFQGALNAAAGLDPTLLTTYSGQSKTGGVVGIGAAAEYQVADQFFLGGHLGFDNSRDYRQTVGGLYLRYSFARLPQSVLYTPRPLRHAVSPY